MSYLLRNKKTGVEFWCEQETLDQITDLKMWGTYERINPTNSKKTDKPVIAPNEVIEFINQKEIKPETMPENKPRYKPKAVTPNVEDWSKDVESTAKALEGVDSNFTADLSDSKLSIDEKKKSAQKQIKDNQIRRQQS